MIRIGSLHVVTDRAIGEAQARTLGASFGKALRAALRETSDTRDTRIDRVTIELPAAAMHDRAALREAVRGVAGQIHDRTTEPR